MFEKAVAPSRPHEVSLGKEAFYLKEGHTGSYGDSVSPGPGSRAWGYVAAPSLGKCDVSSAQATGLHSTENCVVLGEFSEVPLAFLQGLLMSSAVSLKASSWGPGQVAGVSGPVV